MALAALVDFDRCQTNSTLAGLTGAQLDALTNAASSAIRAFTHRDFTSTAYSEYYSGGTYIKEPIRLRQYPVTEINRIATANQCIWVTNSGNGGTVQRATVETLSGGDLQLITYASGVKTANTISIASKVTVKSVSDAITSLGNGWKTAIYAGSAGAYDNFPSADLKPLQGAFSAMVGGGYLEIYEDWYGWNSAVFWPDDEYELGSVQPFWRLDDQLGEVYGRFPRGQLNLRIDYTAGYATIPQDIQEACVQLAAYLYQTSAKDSSVSSYRLGDEAMTLKDRWPQTVKALLGPHVAHDRTILWG